LGGAGAERATGEAQSRVAIESPGGGTGFQCRTLNIALGVLIAAVPLVSYPLAPYALKWAVLGLLTPVVGFLWLRGGCGRPFRPFPTLVAPVVALLVVSEVSLFHALNFYYGFQRFVILLVLFLLFLAVAYTFARPEYRRRLVRYLLLTLLAVSALSLVGCPLRLGGEMFTPVDSLFRLFGNRSYGAAYLLTMIPLCLAVYLGAAKRWEQVVWGSTLFLSMVLLTLSMTRGAWAAIWLGFGIVLWVLCRAGRTTDGVQRIPRHAMITGALIIAGGIALGSAVSPVCLAGEESLGQHIASMFDLGTSSMQIRLAVWDGTLQLIRDHFLGGVGLGNFLFAFVPYRSAVIYQNPGVRIEHPHNELLNTWAELGTLGLVVLLWLAVRVLKLGWGLVVQGRGQREILAGVLGGLVASAAYANLFYVGHLPASAMNIVILLGMLVGMAREGEGQGRAQPVRLTLLVPGLLIAFVLGVEYFVRPLAGEIIYWQAERSIGVKRIEAGLTLLDRSLVWDPHSYTARYRRAAIFYAMRRYPETIREAEMATRIHPTMDVAYGIKASAYLRLGMQDKAEEIFRQALAINPNYPHALNNLGLIAARSGRTAEAEALLLRATEILGRTEMRPYANLGDLYEMTGRTRDALQMYETAVTIQPKSSSNWYSVARLKVLTDGQQGAYDALAQAIHLDEKWRAMAAKDPAFAAVRQSDPRVRDLLHPSTDDD